MVDATKPQFLDPAPSRGQYDRSLTRLERHQRQRERLLYWAAREFQARGLGLTVQHVVQAAGSGRNTFYEYFDDLDNVLDQSAHWVAQRLETELAARLDEARTPIARMKILSTSWFDNLQSDPAGVAVCVRRRADDSHDSLTYGARLFARLLSIAVGPEKLARHCRATPHLDLAVAHAVVGLTHWSLAGGAKPAELTAPVQTLLLDVFR